MIPYGKQNIQAAELAFVRKVLASDWITQGPAIPTFEQAVAQYTGARFGVTVSNGTTALHLAYLAAGIQAGDEIIIPANTFVATANAALYIGARPIFADIDPVYANLNPKDIEHRITKRTKAIVPVHFAGRPCDMTAIQRIAKRHRLVVIEDAAHALGAKLGRRFVGNLGSLVTTFSFHPVKSITTGEGGMVMTNDPKVAKRLRLLRSHGVTKDSHGNNIMTELGYNYRLTDFQAALGSTQMKRLELFIRQRHLVVDWYRRALGSLPAVQLPEEGRGVRSAWHIYVIRVRDPKQRDPLRKYLVQAGIGANFHYPAVYSHPYYRRHGYRHTALPETDRYAASCITLPLHTLLKPADIAYIADTIRRFYR